MPRPAMTEKEFEQTRLRILTEAKAIVGKSGFASLSMRNLAAKVGLTPGALYRYFPAKNDIIFSFWEESIRRLGERVMAIDEHDIGAYDAVRAMLEVYARFALEDRDRFRLLFLENDGGITAEIFRDEGALTPYDLMVSRVATAIEQGHFRKDSAERVAQTLWAATHGAVTLLITVTEIDLGDGDILVRNTIDAVMRGLAA